MKFSKPIDLEARSFFKHQLINKTDSGEKATFNAK